MLKFLEQVRYHHRLRKEAQRKREYWQVNYFSKGGVI